MNDTLEELRKELDTLDSQLVELLAARFSVTKRVGEYKRDNKLAPVDLEREKAIFEKLARLADEQKVNTELVHDIFERIISKVRSDHAELQGDVSG